MLLLSRPALRSVDFEREFEHAYKIGCPILPLLIDISREEFEKRAGSWRRMLGLSPIIEYRRSDPLGEIVQRIEASAQSLGIGVNERMTAVPLESARPCTGQIWATDANQIDIHDLDRVLFRNGAIDDFLNRKHRHFISATKGFGKTLLLTYKRRLLTQLSDECGQPVTMVPEGRPYLDFMSEMRSLSSRYEQPLSSLSNTKRLWSAALRISAISHHPAVIDDRDAAELAAFPSRIQRWLRGAKIQPTVAFKEATALRVSELNQLIDRTENFLDQKMRQIHGGTYFFIDKVDQAIRHLSRDAWIAIQAGLIEAAWDTMSANSHLKIFASIRQEAFSNYQSDIKSNLFAATTNLNYSEEELEALLDQLARCYENCRSFADFLGLKVVRHGRRPVPEDSFQYARRHTCGRPRDLVAIASEISSKRSTLSEKRLREIVQQTSSTVVVSNIFDEVRVFLNCLGDKDARLRFFAGLPGNILEKPDAIRVCEEFNGLEPGTLEHFGEDSSDIFHPFLDLYLAGLLGVLEYDSEMEVTVQRFRRPHDWLAHSAADLPDSPVFLIHPALDTFIRAPANPPAIPAIPTCAGRRKSALGAVFPDADPNRKAVAEGGQSPVRRSGAPGGQAGAIAAEFREDAAGARRDRDQRRLENSLRAAKRRSLRRNAALAGGVAGGALTAPARWQASRAADHARLCGVRPRRESWESRLKNLSGIARRHLLGSAGDWGCRRNSLCLVGQSLMNRLPLAFALLSLLALAPGCGAGSDKAAQRHEATANRARQPSARTVKRRPASRLTQRRRPTSRIRRRVAAPSSHRASRRWGLG